MEVIKTYRTFLREECLYVILVICWMAFKLLCHEDVSFKNPKLVTKKLFNLS